MHIALWSPAWPLSKYPNGIITYVHWTKRALEGQGHRVSVFTGDVDYPITERGVYHVRPPPWERLRRFVGRQGLSNDDIFGFSKVIASAILRVHRRDPIDIVEMEESFGWFADVLRLTSLPVVVKLHGPAFLSFVEDESNSSLGREKIEREGRALKSVSTIVSPSNSTLAQTVERYQLTPKETRRIANPLEMAGDTPLWRLDGCDPNSILFVGRFDLRKGADVVLKAFSSLLKSRPNLKLIFVGPDYGLPAPDGQRIGFNAYCDSLFPNELRRQIDFRGRMANIEIAKLRTQAMATVIASRWENQGYTLLEAMFQGCPVVSTDAGGCRESVTHGVTGRLAKSEDPDDFARQLLAVLDDPKGAECMGQAARGYVVEQHSAARIAADSLEVYKTAISSHAQRPL